MSIEREHLLSVSSTIVQTNLGKFFSEFLLSLLENLAQSLRNEFSSELHNDSTTAPAMLFRALGGLKAFMDTTANLFANKLISLKLLFASNGREQGNNVNTL